MSEHLVDELESQIKEARRSISSDGYPMSIGELTNLYRDKELKIRPEFQRLFRWSELQKSRLIESLLLGIPLPSIFVAQDESGKWELVDGLQRVSTILQLQGELLISEKTKYTPLVLCGTKYLPGLEGRSWTNDDPDKSLSEAQRLDIKRSKIDIKIIKRESSPETKYDLFQRLNSYGSPLTPQETRSALLVAISPAFLTWVEELAATPSFIACTGLNEGQIEERFDLELVIRFLALHALPEDRLTRRELRDYSQFLDNESVEMAKIYPERTQELQRVFQETFDYISNNGGEDVFRRWDGNKEQFKGPFLSSAFEVFGLGVGYHFANNSSVTNDIITVVKEFWSQPAMAGGFTTGRSTDRRLREYIPIGRRLVSRKRRGK